jgi:hypothetical protein
MPQRELNSGALHPRTWKVQIRSGGGVVSEGEPGFTQGYSPTRYVMATYITRWMPQPAWPTARQDLLSLDSLRALQDSDRSGMQQFQGYTFSIAGILWRGCCDAVDRAWIVKCATGKQQVSCQSVADSGEPLDVSKRVQLELQPARPCLLRW